MNHFSEINFLPPQLLGSQSHLCWVCRFAPIHQKEDINHAVCSSILLSLIYPTLFNTLNMSLFLVAELTDFSLTTQSIYLTKYPRVAMSCSLFLLLTTTTYLFYNVTYYFLIARGFLWSSVMLLLYLNRLLSCVSIHLTSLHFPCCCSVISLKDAFSLFFRYLYTKFFFCY